MYMQKKKNNSRRRGLKSRPLSYKASALPLSYAGWHLYLEWNMHLNILFHSNNTPFWGQHSNQLSLQHAVLRTVFLGAQIFLWRVKFALLTSNNDNSFGIKRLLTRWIPKAFFPLCFSQKNHAQHEASDQNKLCRSLSGGHLCDVQVCELIHCGREKCWSGREFRHIRTKSGTHFWCRSKLLEWCYFVAYC